MLNRLFVALFILAGLFVARGYFGRAAVKPVPTADEVAPAPGAAARDVASVDAATVRKAKRDLIAKAVRSRADIAPETLLERKRGGVAPPSSDVVGGAPLARYANLRLKLGAPVRGVGHGFLPLAARAVRAETYTSALGPILIEENNLRVVADERDGWAELKTSADGQPLMVNPSNGRLALVTGTIEVAVANVELAEALADAENLLLINYDRTIGVGFFKAPVDYALVPALRRIGARPGVGTVDLEIVESRKAAR